MADTIRPLKETVRQYMERRTLAEDPPPTPDEIREQLGWHMIPENRRPDQRDK